MLNRIQEGKGEIPGGGSTGDIPGRVFQPEKTL